MDLPPSVRIIAAGDMIPHTAVKLHAEAHGWDSLFLGVKPVLESGDWTVVNLETPVAPNRNGATAEKVFNAPAEMLTALTEAGVDAVSIANNHAYDQGRAGLLETLEHVDAAGLQRAGAGATCAEARRAQIVERNGMRFGWISATTIFNLDYNRGEEELCVFSFDPAAVVASAVAARAAGAEFVIASLHWGQEYEYKPRSWVVEHARQLIAGGVDLVIGHHPHVVQPITWIEAGGRRGLVAYSLGNFVTNQGVAHALDATHAPRRDSVLFDVLLERRDSGIAIASVVTHPFTVERGARACVGGPSRLRAISFAEAWQEAQLAPDTAHCGPIYETRYTELRRVVGEEWVAPWSTPEVVAAP